MTNIGLLCANSFRDTIAALTGAPALVVVRDTDVFHPGEPNCIIITLGDEYEEKALSGAGTDTDQGDRLMVYPVGFSHYTVNLAENQTGLATRQDFITTCQKTLNRKSVTSVTSIYDTALERRRMWEPEFFKQGVEKSVWMLLCRSAETRLGN